jgi:ubiquinone/menaquinone biosynthesis C-methylase UbiE
MHTDRHYNPKRSNRNQNNNRSIPKGWDDLAEWYNGWVGKEGSKYHNKLAIPTVLKLLKVKPGERILDVGCGQGVLSPHISQAGANYVGIDVSEKLLKFAKQHHGGDINLTTSVSFEQMSATQLHTHFEPNSFDAAIFMLSIQDMNPLPPIFKSVAQVLNPGGRVVILMIHPAFRIPRQSAWGEETDRKIKYRRIDRYLTPLDIPRKEYPGRKSGMSISFHRPIHTYINELSAQGMAVTQMVEVAPGNVMDKPNRTRAEIRADEEIPVFMGLCAVKK